MNRSDTIVDGLKYHVRSGLAYDYRLLKTYDRLNLLLSHSCHLLLVLLSTRFVLCLISCQLFCLFGVYLVGSLARPVDSIFILLLGFIRMFSEFPIFV